MQRKKSACQLALEHFDLHYTPVYDYQWPSIRAALLSKPKHCALINSFAADQKQIGMSLAELGAHDFIWTAREKFVNKQLKDISCGTSSSVTEGVSVLHLYDLLLLLLKVVLAVRKMVGSRISPRLKVSCVIRKAVCDVHEFMFHMIPMQQSGAA